MPGVGILFVEIFAWPVIIQDLFQMSPPQKPSLTTYVITTYFLHFHWKKSYLFLISIPLPLKCMLREA